MDQSELGLVKDQVNTGQCREFSAGQKGNQITQTNIYTMDRRAWWATVHSQTGPTVIYKVLFTFRRRINERSEEDPELVQVGSFH